MVKDSEKDSERQDTHRRKTAERQDTHKRKRKTGHPQLKDRKDSEERQDTHNSSENPASTRTNCPYPN
jgi:hypothetical protein